MPKDPVEPARARHLNTARCHDTASSVNPPEQGHPRPTAGSVPSGRVCVCAGTTLETHHEQTSEPLAGSAVRARPQEGGRGTREALGRTTGPLGLAGEEVRMTHTYFHAASSARVWGGEPEDYLPVHDWFDETKKVFCDFRHRALRHHAEGIFLAEAVFGTTITNSAGKNVPVRYIGEQHTIEDCSRVPTAKDWLELMPVPAWLTPHDVDSTYAHAEASAARWGGEPEDYLAVHEWLDETRRAFWDPRHMALRHHAEGIYLCEQILGPAIVNTGGRAIRVRNIAEQHVQRDCGRVPAAEEYLKLIQRRGWMARATKIRHAGHGAGHGVRRGE